MQLAQLEDLIDRELQGQQQTAVEEFSSWHEARKEPLQARYYRHLLPTAAPKAGQQYAFEVDLDACSGCKACVVACHNLNGLETEETWRSVGLLLGGNDESPCVQHVTTACHHCLEPACLDGCPVEAYEKDPVTGIVRHLDDQCIGCQYCILKCPYDVPKYSAAKGIVRKCDMCSNRLAVGEAPACVQSCPNQAIRITIVNQADVAQSAEANLFLPGAPEPRYTLPSSLYKTKKPLPNNLLPADYYAGSPQHAHLPLVAMLVLTQLSAGAFLIDQALHAGEYAFGVPPDESTRRLHVAVALLFGLMGLFSSIFHLGRPWLAYRAVIGWRTSWLSREVLVFGLFAGSACCYAALVWSSSISSLAGDFGERLLGCIVALSGLAGVFCSAMIYASTRRVYWNAIYTAPKFFLTCFILGGAAMLLLQLLGAAWSGGKPVPEFVVGLSVGVILATVLKLAGEASIFGWLRTRTFTPLRRTAMLMTGALRRETAARFLFGFFGGIAAPSILAANYSGEAPPPLGFAISVAVAAFFLSFVGEFLERYLFFSAVVAPKMPGASAA